MKRETPRGRRGDRALECHYVFGGTNQGVISLNTYGRNPYLPNNIDAPNNIWSYIYMGYSHDLMRVYGAVVQPGLYKDSLNEKVVHKLQDKLYLFVGKDEVYESFNGIMAYCTLYVGPKSYREGLVFDHSFGFENAANLFQLGKPLVQTDDEQGEPNKIRESRYDNSKDVFRDGIKHGDQKARINGQSEYSYSLWSRWLKCSPIFLSNR